MLFWLGVVVVAAVAGLRFFAGYPVPVRSLQVLRRGEAGCLAAAGDALFPAGGAIPASGADADVAGYVDRLLAVSQPRQRLLIRLLLFLVEHGTVFFPAPGGLRGLRRFSSLDRAQREAVLEGWRTSGLYPRRLVFTSLRAILTLGYLSHPPVLRALRLAPYEIDTPVCEADLLYPPIGASRRTIGWTRDDLTPPSDGRPLDILGPLREGYRG